MKQFFSDDRIARALDRANDFWDARDNSPRISIYTEPVYRQEQDAAKMLDLAEQCIWKDAENREEDILPSFWPDFGTISTARFWGGEIIPAPKNGFIHVKPIAHNVSDLANLVCILPQLVRLRSPQGCRKSLWALRQNQARDLLSKPHV